VQVHRYDRSPRAAERKKSGTDNPPQIFFHLFPKLRARLQQDDPLIPEYAARASTRADTITSNHYGCAVSTAASDLPE
jgi:hypothetical protein